MSIIFIQNEEKAIDILQNECYYNYDDSNWRIVLTTAGKKTAPRLWHGAAVGYRGLCRRWRLT